jgi:DNA polymerase-3 subunit epsilon
MKEHQSKAIELAKQKIALKPVYLDTETTGFGILDVIVEVALIDWDGSLLFESLVNPNKPIPPGATAVHHITDATIAFSPKWSAVWPDVQKALDGRVLAAYNTEFDVRMLAQSCGLIGIKWIPPFVDDLDVMKIFATYYGETNTRNYGYKYKKLAFAGTHLGLPEPNSHRAKDDAILTRLVLETLADLR